jgi:hypothetical protein
LIFSVIDPYEEPEDVNDDDNTQLATNAQEVSSQISNIATRVAKRQRKSKQI